MAQTVETTPKTEILEKASKFFRDVIAPNHLSNLRKLKKLSSFSYNPFLIEYLAAFMGGKVTAENVAKILIYPRILGTSINTSFGNNLQKFCSVALPGYGSAVAGIDLEFVDQVGGRRKYCQIKAGPQTINKDDIETIDRHFKDIKNLAKTNSLDLRLTDLVVGVLYGTKAELLDHYKRLGEDYQLFVGQEFWYRLTGDKDFYDDLIDEFGKIAIETNGKKELDATIKQLATEIAREFEVE